MMNFRPSLAWSPPPSSPSRLHTEEAGDGDSVVTQWVMNLPDFRAQREFEMAKLFRLSARNPNLGATRTSASSAPLANGQVVDNSFLGRARSSLRRSRVAQEVDVNERLGLLANPKRLSFVFLGPSGSGKSALLLRRAKNWFLQTYDPTAIELYTTTCLVGGIPTDVEMWDTAGTGDPCCLQVLAYVNWDAVFICIGLESVANIERAKNFFNIAKSACPTAPVILVGTKHDMRIASREQEVGHRLLITNDRLRELAVEMNALAYFECSARDSLGVDAVFDITVDLLIRQRRGQIIKTPFPGLKLDDNAGAAPNNDMKGTVGVNNNGDRKKTGRRTSKLLCFA